MNSIFVFLFGKLRAVGSRISESRYASEILRLAVKNNPTCRIESTSLNRVVWGKYAAVLSGAQLNDVRVSDFSYISNGSVLNNVELGKFCSIGPRVQIGLGPHPSRVFVSTYPAFYSESNTGCPLRLRENKIFNDDIPKTIVDNDVWIGANVIIPGGIHIGTGAVVAAGSVVVKDVSPYAIVGGNPAKFIRYRFSDDQIEVLMKSKWWDWPIDIIRKRVDYFSDIEKFETL
jgi:acetyltransferase-like isoleucine patch superfamily enzyme